MKNITDPGPVNPGRIKKSKKVGHHFFAFLGWFLNFMGVPDVFQGCPYHVFFGLVKAFSFSALKTFQPAQNASEPKHPWFTSGSTPPW
jgi:hypothetical protein